MSPAQNALKAAAEYPYDASDAWLDAETPSNPPAATDWAHAAARGVIHDLSDRRSIKNGFEEVDEEVRAEIVASLAAIIREARAQDITP